MSISVGDLLQFFGIVAAGFGVYAGVKTDLAITRAKADAAAVSAHSAHSRIDDILKRRNDS